MIMCKWYAGGEKNPNVFFLYKVKYAYKKQRVKKLKTRKNDRKLA